MASEKRLVYLDNLKVVLIAAIIAGHGVLSYAGTVTWWSYADVHEVTLAPVTEAALFAVAGPFALFMIALLFLVAGLLTPPALARKGPGRFARDRLLRLGVPFAVFVGLLWPLLMYALYRWLGDASGSYWDEFIDDEGNIDTGPLWFVGVLLIFSLLQAGVVRLRRPATRPPAEDLGVRQLAMVAGAVAVATFLVRLVFPFASESATDLNLWEWPACAALFTLGIAASRQGWLSAVPAGLYRRCRAASVVAMATAVAFGILVVLLGTAEEELTGGWHWQAAVFATIESALTVFGSVWLLGAAQRGLARHLPAGRQAGRSAYGAFMLQGPVLIGLAVALRPVSAPAEVKALVVALVGVLGSFLLAWLLISRVPPTARIL